jgi:hypothetical protein
MHHSFIDMESLTAHVRTRLYFTSESHVHSLINSLRLWSKEDVRCPWGLHIRVLVVAGNDTHACLGLFG